MIKIRTRGWHTSSTISNSLVPCNFKEDKIKMIIRIKALANRIFVITMEGYSRTDTTPKEVVRVFKFLVRFNIPGVAALLLLGVAVLGVLGYWGSSG